LNTEVEGSEEHSPMNTHQPGDVYRNDTVHLERLENSRDTICSEEVQADRLSWEGEWRKSG